MHKPQRFAESKSSYCGWRCCHCSYTGAYYRWNQAVAVNARATTGRAENICSQTGILWRREYSSMHSFSQDAEGHMLVDLLIPSSAFPEFYLIISRGDERFQYECDKVKDIRTQVQCIGREMFPGESLQFTLFLLKRNVCWQRDNSPSLDCCFQQWLQGRSNRHPLLPNFPPLFFLRLLRLW